jgi:hypothetical protein
MLSMHAFAIILNNVLYQQIREVIYLSSAAPYSLGYPHGFAEWLTLTSNIHIHNMCIFMFFSSHLIFNPRKIILHYGVVDDN